jgi:hypothetical protein
MMEPTARQRLKAQSRMQVILRVLAGQMTATAGAQALGISRQTFYDWQNRALHALDQALTDQPPGRPPTPPDPEQDRLRAQVSTLEADLETFQRAQRIREVLNTAHEPEEKKRGPHDRGP